MTSISAPSPVSFPSKGAKKAGKAAVAKTQDRKCLIAIRDFTKRAEVIFKSTKHKIQVPSGIFALLDDVISFRKEYSRWVARQLMRDHGPRLKAIFILSTSFSKLKVFYANKNVQCQRGDGPMKRRTELHRKRTQSTCLKP